MSLSDDGVPKLVAPINRRALTEAERTHVQAFSSLLTKRPPERETNPTVPLAWQALELLAAAGPRLAERSFISGSLRLLGETESAPASADGPHPLLALFVGSVLQYALAENSRAALGVLRLRPSLITALGAAWGAGTYDAGPALVAVACADQTGALCETVTAAVLYAVRRAPSDRTFLGLSAAIRNYNAIGSRAPESYYDEVVASVVKAALEARPLPTPGGEGAQHTTTARPPVAAMWRSASMPSLRTCVASVVPEAVLMQPLGTGSAVPIDAMALVLRMSSAEAFKKDDLLLKAAVGLMPHLRGVAPEDWQRAGFLVICAGVILDRGVGRYETEPGKLSPIGMLGPAVFDLVVRFAGHTTVTRTALAVTYRSSERCEAIARIAALAAPRVARATDKLVSFGDSRSRHCVSSGKELIVQLAALDRLPSWHGSIRSAFEALLVERCVGVDRVGAMCACKILFWLLDSCGTFVMPKPPPIGGKTKRKAHAPLFSMNPATPQSPLLENATVDVICQMVAAKPNAGDDPWWLILACYVLRNGHEVQAASVAHSVMARWDDIQLNATQSSQHCLPFYVQLAMSVTQFAARCRNKSAFPKPAAVAIKEYYSSHKKILEPPHVGHEPRFTVAIMREGPPPAAPVRKFTLTGMRSKPTDPAPLPAIGVGSPGKPSTSGHRKLKSSLN